MIRNLLVRQLKKYSNKKSNMVIGVITIIIMILATIPAYLMLRKEPTRIDIFDIKVGNIKVNCNNRDTVSLFYTIAYISGQRLGKGLPYYVFVDQTENTCKNDYTFFYKNGKYMCYNSYDYGTRTVNCASAFFPLGEEPVLTHSYLSNETDRFFDEVNNNETCKISESINVCAYIDEKTFCSSPQEISLEFIPCDSPTS